MQPARIKLHAKEHTNNPVQRPNFRGHSLKMEMIYSISCNKCREDAPESTETETMCSESNGNPCS